MSHTPEIYPLCQLPDANVERYGAAAPCLLIRDNASRTWHEMSQQAFADLTHRMAAALLRFGIRPQEGVAILSENKGEFLALDLAVQQIRAFSIPIYASSAAGEIRHIVTEAEIRLIFVGDDRQHSMVSEVVKDLDCTVVCIEPSERRPFDGIRLTDFTQMEEGEYERYRTEIKERMAEYSLDDIAFILYTSGTTGTSKGVPLTQRNIVTAIKAHLVIEGMKPGRVSLMFLPLAHIFEKMFSLLCLQCGVTIAVNENARSLFHSLKEVHPHFMCSVPRLWEKLHQGLMKYVREAPKSLQSVARRSMSVATAYQEKYISTGRRAPLLRRLQYKFYDDIFFHTIKKRLGIDRGLVFPTSGAALNEHVYRSLLSMGIPIMYGYGLTETTASVSFSRQGDFVISSVGRVIDPVEVRIDESEGGEILVRGDTVTPGYYKRPEENAKVFTADGFFRTGDLGRIDEKRNLFYIERKKDLYKTSNGKYIAPNFLEGQILQDELFSQVVTIGDKRNYVTALVVPDYKVLSELMGEGAPTDPAVLSTSEEAQRIVKEHINATLREQAYYEQVRRFVLLTEPFSIENGLLTSTMKIRRARIIERYTPEIDSMYGYSVDKKPHL